MVDNSRKCFIQATSCNKGAIGVFHVLGSEDELSIFVDARMSGDNGQTFFNCLKDGELKYGIFYAADLSELDEVISAKPRAGLRVVMCHGGRYITQAIKQYFVRSGFTEMALEDFDDGENDPNDAMTAMLAACLTQTQVARVIDWFADASKEGSRRVPPATLLTVQHLCLVGPPNAGKSSLLNRLCGFDRAFVHNEAGATRDVVGEYVEMAGQAVLVDDFPGFSLPATGMEPLWNRASTRLKHATCVAFVCDGSREWDDAAECAAEAVAAVLANNRTKEGRCDPPVLVVLNKADLPRRVTGRPWEKFFPSAVATPLCSLVGGDAETKFSKAFAALFDDQVL